MVGKAMWVFVMVGAHFGIREKVFSLDVVYMNDNLIIKLMITLWENQKNKGSEE